MYSKLSTDFPVTIVTPIQTISARSETYISLYSYGGMRITNGEPLLFTDLYLEYVTNLYIKDTEFSESDYKFQHFVVGTVRLCLQIHGLGRK